MVRTFVLEGIGGALPGLSGTCGFSFCVSRFSSPSAVSLQELVDFSSVQLECARIVDKPPRRAICI
jgi:hypothetical protein